MRVASLFIVALFASATSFASDTLSFDTVLITTFQASNNANEAYADQLYQQLVAVMAPNHELISMSEVPAFSDYGAEIYMQACPPGRYAGCALVVGGRIDVDWVIGGFVNEVDGDVIVEIVFIEPSEGREVVNVELPVSRGNESAFAEAVMRLYDDVIRGAYEDVDLRDLSDEEARRVIDAKRASLLAASLAELEQSLGPISRTDSRGAVDRQKVTRASLAKYDGREDGAPWTRAGLTRSSYIRYSNLDLPVDDFKTLRRGRFMQVLLRVSLGGGAGPFHQRFDGRYQLDSMLQPSEVTQILETTRGSTLAPEVEVGFGVAPFLEVSAHLGSRSGSFGYRIEQSIEGQPYIPRSEIRKAASRTVYGARATFAPMATYLIRPTMTGGVTLWRGRRYEQVVQTPDFFQPSTTPSSVFLDLMPGAELSAGKTVNLFARGVFGLPVVRVDHVQFLNNGGNTLPERPVELGGHDTPHVGFQAGLLVRLDPFGGSKKKTTPGSRVRRGGGMQFDEEEDGL